MVRMTTTGPLPIHRPRCSGDPSDVTTRVAVFSTLRVFIRTCGTCGGVALERIPDRKDGYGS